MARKRRKKLLGPQGPVGLVPRGIGRKARGRKEVAGPYLDQSSKRKYRKRAIPAEHRKAATTVRGAKREARAKRPIPTLERAERKLATKPSKELREATKRLRHALAAEARFKASRPSPEGSPVKANYPEPALEKVAPRAYRKARRLAEPGGHGSSRGLGEPEDLTTAITLAAPGAGLAGRAAAKGLEAAAAKIATKSAEKAAQEGERLTAKEVAARATKAAERKVERVKTAPERAARRVKEAPAKARTAEGRREAARGAAKAARRHPVRTSYGAAAVSPVPLPGEADKRARAAAEGLAKAVAEHPLETLETTGRALPAAITAPAALLESAGLSVIHGNPKYLTKTASEQAKGVAHIAGQTFSGDTKKAEEAFRKEGAGAFLAPLPAISRLKVFRRAKEGVRDVAARGRRRLATHSEELNRRVRHAPEGTSQGLTGLGERHAHRKRVALLKSRTDNPHRVSASRHMKNVRDAIAKAPKGSHVALQTLAEYGIRDSKGADLVRRQGPGDKQLVKALDYAQAHPEVFKDKHFKKALKAVEKAGEGTAAAMVGKGERARLMQQGDALDILRPEEMAPKKARELTGQESRIAAWHALEATEKQITRLRKAGRDRLVESRRASAKQAAKLKAGTKVQYAEARRLEAHAKELRTSLEPYTRPSQSIDRSVRRPYDKAMLDEYKRKVEAARKSAGLSKAIWTHHAEADTARGTGLENRFPTNAGRVEHMREGSLAKQDNLDRSLEAVLRGTVQMPRLRAAGKEFGRNLVREFQTPFEIDGKRTIVGQGSKDWKAITGRRTRENPNGGQFDPRSWARFPLREWKNAIKDPFTTEHDLTGILKMAEEGKVKGSEPWVLMPREVIREARAQINPEFGPITKGLNTMARTASRTILGTNPAWAIAQTAAEGIPLLLAKPSLALKGAAISRDLAAYRKAKPEEAAYIDATAGAAPHSAAAAHTPLDQMETYTPQLWEKGAKALTRGKGARTALSVASLRALGELDRARQNQYRSVLFAAEADKRFRSFHGSLTHLFDAEAKLSQRFKTRQELWDWLSKDPKGKQAAQKIADYVDNIQGNWTSFTRYERAMAPLAIFYPFLRYSLRWPLWAFPKEHPIRATIAYTLGQANSNELEKLLGGKPSNPLKYAWPVYSTPSGEKAVLPAGTRISPGQSALTQALTSGKPGQILSASNPFLAAGITGLTGTEPLSGEKSSQPRGIAALNQLLAMPAPLRLAGVKLGGRSTASKAFGQYDTRKGLRSGLLPMLPLSGARARGEEQLSRDFEAKYGKGRIPGPFDSPLVQELLFGGPKGGPKPKMLPKVLAAIHASEAGAQRVKAAEAPFFGKGSSFSPLQKELLEAIENAWKTGPGESGGGQYSKALGGAGASSSGGQYANAFGTGSSSSGGQYSKALGR